MNDADLARQVARNLAIDNARKQAIINRSPSVFSAMDAGELAGASSLELAVRELRALGITAKNSDPVELLDAHHAGREFARRGGRPAMDGASPSAVDRFLSGKSDAYWEGYSAEEQRQRQRSSGTMDGASREFLDRYLKE